MLGERRNMSAWAADELGCCTLPPTRIDFGVTALGASFTGGGGGAAEGTDPIIHPERRPECHLELHRERLQPRPRRPSGKLSPDIGDLFGIVLEPSGLVGID